jgi:hypothetical protein
VLDTIGHNLGGGRMQQLGPAIQVAVAVAAELDEGGIIPAASVLRLSRPVSSIFEIVVPLLLALGRAILGPETAVPSTASRDVQCCRGNARPRKRSGV